MVLTPMTFHDPEKQIIQPPNERNKQPEFFYPEIKGLFEFVCDREGRRVINASGGGLIPLRAHPRREPILIPQVSGDSIFSFPADYF